MITLINMPKNSLNLNFNNNQKGQALLFVVVAMTIALTVGISVTSRTVTSLRRTSSTDTSARVFAAAEGGIEWFLRQPMAVLNALADGNSNGGADCPTGTSGSTTNVGACLLTYQPQTNETRGQDEIQTKATVNISLFRLNDPSNNTYYWFNLEPGDVKEVRLQDFQTSTFYNGTINICWKTLDPSQSSVLYYHTLYSGGIDQKRLLAPSGTIAGSINVTGDTVASGGQLEFTSCYSTSAPGNLFAIRFKSLYAPSKVAVFPSDTINFPHQGYKITSLGELDSAAEQNTQKKEITAYRSLPYAAGIFDNAIYSDQPLD